MMIPTANMSHTMGGVRPAGAGAASARDPSPAGALG